MVYTLLYIRKIKRCAHRWRWCLLVAGVSWWRWCLLVAGVSWWPVVPPGGWCAHRWRWCLLVAGGAHRWRWCLLVAGGAHRWRWCLLVAVAASYCQPIPGRRTGGSRFRAAGLIRLNQSFRGNHSERIALNINYLYSPVGRKKTR